MGTPGEVVPIVPSAVIFDLGRGGDFALRPGREMGKEAYDAALSSPSGSHHPDQRGAGWTGKCGVIGFFAHFPSRAQGKVAASTKVKDHGARHDGNDLTWCAH